MLCFREYVTTIRKELPQFGEYKLSPSGFTVPPLPDFKSQGEINMNGTFWPKPENEVNLFGVRSKKQPDFGKIKE